MPIPRCFAVNSFIELDEHLLTKHEKDELYLLSERQWQVYNEKHVQHISMV